MSVIVIVPKKDKKKGCKSIAVQLKGIMFAPAKRDMFLFSGVLYHVFPLFSGG